jgi:uncharacterized protein YcfL
MKYLFVIITILLLAGCVSNKKMMDSWMNNSKHDLVLKWGPPTRVASDGSSGEIYIYEKRYYIYNVLRYDFKMFYINSSSVIYSWRTESGPVPAEQLNVNLYIR